MNNYKQKSELLQKILIDNNVNGFEAPGGTDKATDHSYTDVYEKLFSKYLNKKINFLEVGTYKGGSMILWHEFMPDAYFDFVDIQNNVHHSVLSKLNSDRYTFHTVNAYTQESADAIAGDKKYSIAVDDGPHTLESFKLFIQLYIPKMEKDGIMVIEDIQSFDWINTLQSVTPDGYKSEVIDLRHLKNRYDDILYVIYT